MTALVAVAVCVVSIARPGIPHRARESMAVLLGSPHGQPDVELAYRDDSVPLEHALAASLAQDRALARRLGSGHVLGARAPEHTFVVSRFPISGGRAVSIYTPLSSPRQDGENDVVFAHDGGVW
ncbi:hypothetical protein JXA88_06300 [Candidatus Fermentibacteria bacterium]|nr:hypothetical protein [Candidatus Fermentibacteria bacterium]